MKNKLFIEKNIEPMLIKEQHQPFSDPDYIFELKMDGLRCIAYLDPEKGTDLRNKRNISLLRLYPELKDIHTCVKHKCILDGELVLFEKGVPNFHRMQKRSILKDSFKIKIAATEAPVSFVAFDILELNEETIMNLPLIERKNRLSLNVRDGERIYVSRYIEEQGELYYEAVLKRNLEGIVAKRKDSIYRPGKRSADWIKIKNTNDDDFIICGYFYQNNKEGLTFILGQYSKEGNLMYRGNVSLGVNNLLFMKNYNVSESHDPIFPFLKIKGIIWLMPTVVCTINYMYKDTGKLRQPVLKGFRDNKKAEECICGPDVN